VREHLNRLRNCNDFDPNLDVICPTPGGLADAISAWPGSGAGATLKVFGSAYAFRWAISASHIQCGFQGT
jgi:hypothetical protein